MSDVASSPDASPPRPADAARALPVPAWRLTATELATGFRAGAVTPTEALEACLGRISAVDPAVNAIVHLDADAARAAAAASDARHAAGTPFGPVDGIPLLIKDNIFVANMPCRWGSAVFSDFVPDADEEGVRRLRAGGAIILGKTNTPEFAAEGHTISALFGTTRNPWNLARTPGGSSGGTVAAVAAGMVPVALGTDGGGSIRRPAAHTGLIGFKPSLDAMWREPGFPPVNFDFEVLGIATRSVADAALLFRAMTGSSTVAHRPRLRIRYIRRFGDSPVDPAVLRATDRAAERLAALGHSVTEGNAPLPPEEAHRILATFVNTGIASVLDAAGPDAALRAGASAQARMDAARSLTSIDYFRAVLAVRAFRSRLRSLFRDEIDLLMTPAAAAQPWPAVEPYPREIDGRDAAPRDHAVYTGFVNAGGLPGIALPCEPDDEGMPIGFQLVAAQGEDEALLSIAAAWEAAHPFAGRLPIDPRGVGASGP